MKISEVRIQYNQQIKSYREQQVLLADRKKELEQKIRTTPDGVTVFANEAATLELQMNAVNEKQDEYREYMDKLMEQWAVVSNMESAKQQGEPADPTEIADNTEAFAEGPEIVDVADTMAAAVETE